ASAVDNFYNDCEAWIIGGTGINQIRSILSYVGSTKVATIYPAWQTTPDNTSLFILMPCGQADLGAINGAASVGAAGYVGLDWGHINAPTTVVNLSGTTIGILTTYTGNTVQTGDSYARLGAPVGANIAADIAEIEGETDGIANCLTT